MQSRKFKLTVVSFLTLFLVFGCFKKTIGLKKSDIKPLISVFLSKHVKYNNNNNEISKRTLHNLIKYIDPGKYYFYKKDIAEFNKFSDKIDDFVENNNYQMLFDIFARYKKRFEENMNLFDKLIKSDFDFSKDESIIINRDLVDYAKDQAEMQERWRKNIKLQLLNYLNVVKSIDKAKAKLKNKYRLTKKRVYEIDQGRMIEIFLNSFSTALDPHSNYLSKEEDEDFMISMKLKLEGIGVLLKSEDGFVIVQRIIPGGAADKLPEELQLKPNDKIIAVAQASGEPVDVIDMDLRDVVKLIRGKSGKQVKLTIIRETEEKGNQLRMIIPIIREEIKLEDNAAKSSTYTITREKSAIKIGYIKLPTFYLDTDAATKHDPTTKSSSSDVQKQINNLKKSGINAIIMDLRANPGGALTEAIYLAGLFIDQGPIVNIKTANNRTNVMYDEDPGVSYDGPIVVLIDRFSASASEIFAGAIKDYRRGLILGPCNTFGKGSVQTYNRLGNNKGAIKVTTALFYQPAGTSNQLHGISPNIEIPDIASIWDIGEDKLDYPITWQKIKQANYLPYKNYLNESIISKLKNKSAARINKSDDFKEIRKKISSLKEKIKSKKISLKEEAFIEKQKESAMKKKDRRRKEDKLIDLENDKFLEEAMRITADYVELLK